MERTGACSFDPKQGFVIVAITSHSPIHGLCLIVTMLLSSAADAVLPGDANLDGIISQLDAGQIQDHILGKIALQGNALANADANGDGRVDVADILYVEAHRLPEKSFMLPGDVPLTLMKIPRGGFQMGSSSDAVGTGWPASDEFPVHTVTFNYDFYMGTYEVTQAQWLAVTGNNPSSFQPPIYTQDLSRPVEQVSWYDVQDFLTTLNGLGLGGNFRLPSEAEWEYSARGGTQTRFSFGDSTCVYGSCYVDCELSQYAWYCGDTPPVGIAGTAPVGRKLPNVYGLYDTAGNIWEWCQDWDHYTYTGAPTDGSAWETPAGVARGLRGGRWNASTGLCRPSQRAYYTPVYSRDDIGFRVAWTP